MAQNRHDRKMSRIGFPAALFAGALSCIAPAAAEVEGGRAAALDYLGRGTAAFRAGDIVAATRDWSEAIRLCRLNAAPISIEPPLRGNLPRHDPPAHVPPMAPVAQIER